MLWAPLLQLLLLWWDSWECKAIANKWHIEEVIFVWTWQRTTDVPLFVRWQGINTNEIMTFEETHPKITYSWSCVTQSCLNTDTMQLLDIPLCLWPCCYEGIDISLTWRTCGEGWHGLHMSRNPWALHHVVLKVQHQGSNTSTEVYCREWNWVQKEWQLRTSRWHSPHLQTVPPCVTKIHK